jgi:large subunit ribosomal protein L16
MMQPKRTKFRKQFKGKISGGAQRQFGCVRRVRSEGHRSLLMTAREIEAARRAISRYVKRGGRIWIRVFPDVPITQKPLEVRMGSGKGNVEYWVARVLPGKVLFEIEGMSEEIAREAFRLASAKLSVSTAFVKRQVRT